MSSHQSLTYKKSQIFPSNTLAHKNCFKSNFKSHFLFTHKKDVWNVNTALSINHSQWERKKNYENVLRERAEKRGRKKCSQKNTFWPQWNKSSRSFKYLIQMCGMWLFLFHLRSFQISHSLKLACKTEGKFHSQKNIYRKNDEKFQNWHTKESKLERKVDIRGEIWDDKHLRVCFMLA